MFRFNKDVSEIYSLINFENFEIKIYQFYNISFLKFKEYKINYIN